MKIQFLGTAASPSVPLPFCHCQVCSAARKAGGKNLRRRSSIKINDDLLVDIGPDITSASADYKIDLSTISMCLQTHFHEDHFDPEMIISRHSDYGTELKNDLLLIASQQTLAIMDETIGRRCSYGSIFDVKVQESLGVKLMPIIPFKDYVIGDYTVTAYPANHGALNQGCFLYKVEYKNKCLFYATDTAILFDEVWMQLNNSKTKFDLIILDHTYGIGYASKPGDHLGSEDFLKHVHQFIDNGLLKKNGQIYATHISHEGILEHSELLDYATRHNYNIAYDGLVIEI